MKNKKQEFENLCLKCNGGTIKRTVTEKENDIEVLIKKCSNKKCNYQYGIKEFYKDYTSIKK